MKIFAALQILLSIILIVVSPISAEMGYVLMVFLMSVGTLGAVGGIGLLKKKRWSWVVSLIANLLFMSPMLHFFLLIVRDLVAHGSTPDVGAFYVFLAVVFPCLAIAYLINNRRRWFG